MARSMHIEIRNVYGSTRYYPRCEAARIFAQIAGTETLTERTLAYAKRLGFHAQVWAPELPAVLTATNPATGKLQTY